MASVDLTPWGIDDDAPAAAAAESVSEKAERVTMLELFFDLVFVFAITQVTALMAADPTWRGLGHGMIVLGVLWWAWVAYAWLTNEIDPEEGSARIVMFGVMAAILVAALAVPRAFDGEGVLFGSAYLVVRVLHLVLYTRGTDDDGVRGAVRRLAPSALAGGALLIAGGAIGETAQTVLWSLALVVDLAGPMIAGVDGWRVSPGHFAERHGLIVIIALGESVVAVGAASGKPVSAGIVLAGTFAIVIAGALWWAYFDVVALVAERHLRGLTGVAQNRVARDSYSYLHLPMIAGIVLIALGIKKTLLHVDAPLHAAPAAALGGGVALYLIGHVLFRLRNVRTWNKQRVVVAVICLALIPLLHSVDALIALAIIAAALASLIAYEALRFREARGRIRHAASPVNA